MTIVSRKHTPRNDIWLAASVHRIYITIITEWHAVVFWWTSILGMTLPHASRSYCCRCTARSLSPALNARGSLLNIFIAVIGNIHVVTLPGDKKKCWMLWSSPVRRKTKLIETSKMGYFGSSAPALNSVCFTVFEKHGHLSRYGLGRVWSREGYTSFFAKYIMHSLELQDFRCVIEFSRIFDKVSIAGTFYYEVWKN